MTRKIQVVVNPGSGQPKPILHTLNQVFRPAGVEWDISITQESGDAERFAREAVEAQVDVVAAFGGDGTVMEVARGVMGSQVPLAILPGGTANLLSVELGIPKDLTKAAEIAASTDSAIKSIDVGEIGGTYFLLRVGLGIAAQKVEFADREMKDRYGIMAYSIAALKAMKDAKQVKYTFNLDGKEFEEEGITCLIDNAGNFGVSGFSASKNISMFDGLLDVILVRDRSFRSFVAIGKSVASSSPTQDTVHHWQAKEIQISTDPPQSIQVDGEIGWETPVSIKVVPGAVRVLTSND
ncbi:MAG: diacylglycerol kinase family lipid kinase [Anaerolineales bacterium]|nr:diacylglycerol kinase family lipid kinase [Anaerolineales bacterium]